jgi:hypothetical protein
MNLLRRAVWLGLVLALALLRPGGARAQDQGVAVITSPLEGGILSGLVPITGTATHPQFQRYELSFAYSPNPTDTWFPLQPPAATQVVNEIIGRWDTTLISDGVYTLRLRVYFSDTAYLEAFVPNIRVQNTAPTQPAPAATPATGTPPGVDYYAAGHANAHRTRHRPCRRQRQRGPRPSPASPAAPAGRRRPAVRSGSMPR